MSDVRFELNLRGLNAVMKSPEMQALINRAAAAMQSVAGDGYEIEPAHPIGFIAIGSVRTGDFKSRLDNSKNNTLLKASGSVKI